MRLADISHSVSGNVITLTWTAVPNSENVEIRLFDEASKDYKTLATVPMSQEKYEYTIEGSNEKFLFAFIPRDSKGTEVRYDVNVRTEAEPTPEVENKKLPATGPVEDFMLIAGVTLILYFGYKLLAPKKA